MEVIYFARGKNKSTKIGRSDDIDLRMYHLRWNEQDKSISVLHLVLCGTQVPHFLESAFHYKFRHKHSHGEWFYLSPDDMTWIKSIKHGNQIDAVALIKRWQLEGQSSNINRTKWLMYKEAIS